MQCPGSMQSSFLVPSLMCCNAYPGGRASGTVLPALRRPALSALEPSPGGDGGADPADNDLWCAHELMPGEMDYREARGAQQRVALELLSQVFPAVVLHQPVGVGYHAALGPAEIDAKGPVGAVNGDLEFRRFEARLGQGD